MSFAKLAGVSAATPKKSAPKASPAKAVAKKAPRSYAHLNAAIPMLQEANEHRRAKAEKAEQAQEATKLAKRVISAGRKGIR